MKEKDKEVKEQSPLVKEAKAYIVDLYAKNAHLNLTYHNFLYAKRCLEYVGDITEDKSESFTENEIENLKLATLFHATGYIKNYENPTAESVAFAKAFLADKNIDPASLKTVVECIEATDPKTKPTTHLQRICKDVSQHEIADNDYFDFSRLMNLEHELMLNESISELDWINMEFEKYSKHHKFYSKYAIKNWEENKQSNLLTLNKKIAKDEKDELKEKRKAFYKEKYKNESPERGIQTLYRVALRNHIKLSDIADTKANILLSVNAIIVSLVIANLIAKLNDPMNRFLIAPTLFFVALCIVSMILAIKVTQPSITRGEFTEEDLEKKRVNLAFFGNFHKMELETFQKAFSSLIKNKEDVYSTLTKDLYFLGIVLDRKYRLLYYTYYAFIVGIILSVVAFSIAFALRDSITL